MDQCDVHNIIRIHNLIFKLSYWCVNIGLVEFLDGTYLITAKG